MARLWTSGWEIEGLGATAVVDPPFTSGTITRDTVVFRSGLASMKCNAAAGNAAAYTTVTFNQGSIVTALTNASQTTYFRLYYNFANAPASTVLIAHFCSLTPAAAAGIGVKLTAAGKLQLFNMGAGTQIGSDSTATLTMDGSTWYRIEVQITKNGSSQANTTELRLDGATVASTSAIAGGSTATANHFGWIEAPGANKVVNVDDFAVNDTSGAASNTWPGSGKIVLLRPISLNLNGGSWTDDNAATTSAALTNAIDNTPPNGIADTAAGGGNHQVRNAAANSSLDMNLTTYTTAGIAATDTVVAVLPAVNVGAPVSTQAKSGSFGITSNPVIANRVFTGGSGTATFFWGGAAPGVWPSNWRWEIGTVTHAPTVTLGNSPVARLTITGGTTTRIAMASIMCLYVDYTSPNTYTKSGFGTEHRVA